MTYKIQIDDVVRDANEDEIARFEAIKTQAKNEIAEAKAKAKAKAELLEKLGITEDEAKLLLA